MPFPFRIGVLSKPLARGTEKPAGSRRRRDAGRLIAIVQTLEPRLLLSATGLDECDHEVDLFGNEYHTIAEPDDALSAGTTGDFDATGTLLPLSQTFFLHSNPGATHTIYLDFDGHVTAGTTWNAAFTGGATISTPAFDFEGGVSVFTTNELSRIQYIWQRVAEDFLPFNVDVTTQDPGAAALSKSGGGDTAWGVRVAIGGNSADWYTPSVGGVAYIGSFNWNSDAPVFVFTDNLADSEKYVAEAISHEVGHGLGLSHDGTSSTSYYQGSGSGATGWAPIMGVGYYRELTTWSRGEYSGANNTEDDLAKITSNNGFGYRTDDYGNTNGTAGSLAVAATSATGSGIIESAADVDVFSFTTGAGTVNFTVSPSNRGANLDVLAELYDSTGQPVTSNNSSTVLSASFTVSVSAGTYYLHVSGVGKGSPTSGGYSDYASIGAYRIDGNVVATQAVDISGNYQYNGGSTQVLQNGNSLTFINERGNSSAGTFLSSTQVIATGWGGLVGTISGNNINWANGSVWTKGTYPTIGGDYTFNGGTTQVLQNGSTLTFVNEHGNTSAGVFIDATHVRATGWGNLVGTISGNNIVWANGTTWAKSTVVNVAGGYAFNGLTTSVLQNGTSLTFVNEHGNSAAGHFLDATHVQATGWGNLVGTLNGNRIDWANGTSWVRSVAAAAAPARSVEFIPQEDSSESVQTTDDATPVFHGLELRLDTIPRDGLAADNTTAIPVDPRYPDSAPIDVDEVFAAFGKLQSSMYETESASRDHSPADDVSVELRADALLDLILELASSREMLS